MAPFPVNLYDYFGHWDAYIVYLVIGFAFGFVLEIAGFGNSRKLAAQFYFTDMTVIKVMFTAIVVAMSLIFLTSALGWLDYDKVWVNPTYLWPGIVGGLLMGVGFIIGGFCPGTSLVSAATLKIDGMFFVLGAFFGIFLFGETVSGFEEFWKSSYHGRYTLMDFFGLEAGVVLLLVVLMALAVFWGSEQLERLVGKQNLSLAPRWRYGAAGALVMVGITTLLIGQPDRSTVISDEKAAKLANREVQVHPVELLKAMHNNFVNLVMIDVRGEDDYNLFHIQGARHIPASDVLDEIDTLRTEPANTVFVVMGNDEKAATRAWRQLVARQMINVFILEGGVNNWLDVLGDETFKAAHPRIEAGDDHLKYTFESAVGADDLTADPNLEDFANVEYVKKITLEKPQSVSPVGDSTPSGGGCG